MTDANAGAPWPTAITYEPSANTLHIAFDSGEHFDLPAEYLRVESPSAEVQGHNPSEKKIVPGRSKVGIMNIEPVGNYAVKLVFDDLHDTGIYSWRYLHELGKEYAARWEKYVAELAKRGLSRDP